jgi:putative DNA primase/helicase
MDSRAVIDQMLAAGLEVPSHLDLTGKVRRFGPKKNSWYALREIRADNGQYVVVGSFGDWKLNVNQKVEVDWRGIGQAERDQMLARRAEQKASEQRERAALAELAALDARSLWMRGQEHGESAYLRRKGVAAEGCRFLPDGSIIIPLVRYDVAKADRLRGLQRIYGADRVAPNGDSLPSKVFTKGFDKPGAALRLGQVEPGAPIVLCEGYATALTVREAIGRRCSVWVCLDAGNLVPVACVVRKLYPSNPMLVCADDDWQTMGPDRKPLNVGRVKAAAVARELLRCQVVYPIFRPGNRGAKDTDFNDLHAREGLAAVSRQLWTPLRYLWPDHARHAA